MHLSHEDLIRIAKETAEKSALSDKNLVAVYLTGSLRKDNPYLGKSTDIDIVMVHEQAPKIHREIIALSPEVHLDIIHNPRNLYDKPRELRIHAWLGPELYDPMPLYVTRHFLEFVQAGVRDRYLDTTNVQARSRQLEEEARKGFRKNQLNPSHGVQLVLDYLKSIHLAANAVAVLVGELLAERRFLLQFPGRAQEAGQPELAGELSNLLGANRVDDKSLAEFLPEWEKTFSAATEKTGVNSRISVARLGYYKMAFESLLASAEPQSIIWPLLLTWTMAVAVLPEKEQVQWRSACAKLGLDEGSFGERMENLEHFLNSVEANQAKLASQAEK